MINQFLIFLKKIVPLVQKEHNSIPKLINVNLLSRYHPNVLQIMFGMKLNKNVSALMLSQSILDVNVLPVYNHSFGTSMKRSAN